MNAEIIAVGSELLLGQIANTNAKYLSEQLSFLGINVFYHSVVGDNEDRLTNVLRQAAERSDLLLLTGGLGPTKDDLTKETVSKLLGMKLIYDQQTEERILAFFKQRNRKMTENNRKQALVLEGAKIFPNDHGLACGMARETDGSMIVLLPGPPSELIPMAENYCFPYLKGMISDQSHIESRVLRFFDIGESQLADRIDDLLEAQSNPTIAPLASGGEVTLRLTVKGKDKQRNNEMLDSVQKKILARLEDYFIGTGQQTLMEKLAERLMEHGKTISSAESLTGGLFAAELTAQPGASSIFPGGFVSYGDEWKHEQLHIPAELLREHGAVSHACAREMAVQAMMSAKADYGIGFTGVAGPEPLEGKAPGLVYIGVSSAGGTDSFEVRLAGSRATIRERTVKYGAYYLLHKIRKEIEKGG
ncbi:nicotinamide-nucleotide amidase [Evansella caseinilytica]|uniref:Putative competence-damage inducible protein n=1 Tax=Evansella caseinilytica TaxID=1503961 RepID=A0A1H3LYP6_9BACI|nr:competence/damage-inducible protein A [Evansella caseinilytica]SDY69456.1 nicotinamide-nucleotide amidase [Evansella caseinilytica]